MLSSCQYTIYTLQQKQSRISSTKQSKVFLKNEKAKFPDLIKIIITSGVDTRFSRNASLIIPETENDDGAPNRS